MEAVRHLLDQMPHPERNRTHLSQTISSSSVALSGPVPWELLKELTFNQDHPVNRIVAGQKEALIKLPELITLMSQAEHKQEVDALTDWSPVRRADDIRKVCAYKELNLPVPPIILFRTHAKKPGEPRWFIFDGCHRALAYAQASFDGKETNQALLKAIFISGSGRHDLQATIYDTRPSSHGPGLRPYEALLCGRASTFFTGHAYGPHAKHQSEAFVAAMQDCSQRPFAISNATEHRDGEVNIFCPPPHQFHSCRGRWGQVFRFDGLSVYMRLPADPTGASCPIHIVCPGHGAMRPRESEAKEGATIWITGKQGRMEKDQPYGLTGVELRKGMRGA
eukprot:5814087-Heterocapsa_arctica.AAC.1